MRLAGGPNTSSAAALNKIIHPFTTELHRMSSNRVTGQDGRHIPNDNQPFPL